MPEAQGLQRKCAALDFGNVQSILGRQTHLNVLASCGDTGELCTTYKKVGAIDTLFGWETLDLYGSD